MRTWLILVAGCLIAVSVVSPDVQGAEQRPASTIAPAISAHQAVLDQYCVVCHNDKLRTAGLVLDKMDLSNVASGAAAWEKVLRKLRARDMPPPGRPRPENSTYDALATWLATALDTTASAAPNPGRPVLHRLNRTEYANVIRDLLALEIDVSLLLPSDDSGYGFDNIADVLKTSPLLMEQYLSAARKISRAAVGSPAIRAVTESYRTAPDH